MSENGEEKYGYHYNETIMNMIFNDYVLNSLKYLQKYKMSIPKEKKRRDQSGINQLKKAGKVRMSQTGLPKGGVDVDRNVDETTGAASSGAFSAPMGFENKVEETTTSASSGAYAGPAAWGGGDLMKGGKSKAMTKPIIVGGTIIQESNYLIDTTGFEKLFESLNEQSDEDFIKSKSDAFSVGKMSGSDKKIIKNDIKSGKLDNANLKIAEGLDNLYQNMNPKDAIQKAAIDFNHATKTGNEAQANKVAGNLKSMLDSSSYNWKQDPYAMDILGDFVNENRKMTIKEKAVSKSQQQLMGMAHAVQTGKLSPDKVGDKATKVADTMKKKDVEDFASTKHKNLPDKVDETEMSMIQQQAPQNSMANKAEGSNVPMGMNTTSGMNESHMKLLEEINNELNAFSIHHDKLKRMAEDRKPSALVLRDRMGSENEKNFKKDLNDSSISDIVDIENSLEYGDQQTDVGNDPQKLGADIEKKALSVGKMKSGEALKNVGDSANDKGDEIPKRNLTTEEQDEVNNYRLGLGDLVYDNKPNKRFEDRMKADMGDKLYQERQDKLAFRAKAPMYNKEAQPTEATGVDKVQFDKEKTGWNERVGIKESIISGKYFDMLGKKRIIGFNLNEVKEINETRQSGLFELSLEGLGNTYTQKVNVNEGVVKAISENKFFTNGKDIFVLKNPKQNLSENKNTGKPVVNEQMNKMKHLLGYKPDTFTNTDNTKLNRGF
jgi:hypothetical protein